jgi:hypothetical protein
MRILILTQFSNDATYWYRLKPLSYIDNPKIKAETKPYAGQIAYSFFDGYTHLIMERPSGMQDLQVIKLAKQCGLYVISDWDDDCLHLDAYNPMFHHYEDAKNTLIDCLNESDEVWVSTPSLRRSFQMFNRNIFIIPNAHNDYLFPLENKAEFNTHNKIVMWRGGGSHLVDVYDMAEKIIKMVNENKETDFYFVGCRFEYMELRCGMNYKPVSLMPLMQYFNFMWEQNPQAVFHPLRNTIFNQSKSGISWMEATYAGAAFFGNKTLPEFDHPFITDLKLLPKAISEHHSDYMHGKNLDAWQYILDNLLLSEINKIREERLLK